MLMRLKCFSLDFKKIIITTKTITSSKSFLTKFLEYLSTFDRKADKEKAAPDKPKSITFH